MEIVMGDGKKVVKQRVSLRDLTFGSKHIAQTVNTTGMAWCECRSGRGDRRRVRAAVWLTPPRIR
jgi:hypothetical protein